MAAPENGAAGAPPRIAGLAAIGRMVYEGADRAPFVSSLRERIADNARDAAALLDMSILLQLMGDREAGLAMQAQALDVSRTYMCVHGSGDGLRVLALVAPGDFMANTPLDFLFDGSNATVYYSYLSPAGEPPSPVPDFDVAYLAVAESDANRPLLEVIGKSLRGWRHPVVNADASRIARLSRDKMWQLFTTEPKVVAPRNARITRQQLAVERDGSLLGEVLPDAQYPLIIRPLDSHAGRGLEKIDSEQSLREYLERTEGGEFYVAPFVDYRGADGQYRKYRIVFIAGHPYIAHLGISQHWMVHYLNAGMHESDSKRDEEADCMARFDDHFASRHQDALAAVATRVGLEYFAVDCAELADGRLLLFEAGTGMIVHSLDSAELFPYKQVQMRKVFGAFRSMLRDAATPPAS